MRRLTLCLLLDAFRSDYLRYAPYLRGLAAGRPAELREPFGFLPRAAYFGGLTPNGVGFTNMYAYDPPQSPFGIARAFDREKTDLETLERLGARDAIDRAAASRVTPFAHTYATSARIPLDIVGSFAVVEQRAPWDRAVGYRSVFHELDERGDRWFECSWPGTNALADHSDPGIVRAALDRADPACRFGFVHLQELDAIGHSYGPEAAATRDAITATDRLVQELVTTLESRWDGVDLLIFGDHGMVSVTRAVDVLAWLDALPLRRSLDYSCFVDSTMVRVWLHTTVARAILPAAFDAVDGARLLNDDDRRRFHIERCDIRNGEYIVLAEPGVVFLPNFFQGDRVVPRGMHGYDPDCADNRGVLIVRSDAVEPPAGVVDATGVHGLLRSLLFEQGSVAAKRDRRMTSARRPRFTCDANANSEIADQLASIADTVIAETGSPRAIVVTGSFGRGEGGVTRSGDRVTAVNDYDVLVVADEDRSAPLRQLSARLPRELDIDYVDLAWSNGRWDAWLPSMANFDLKYGSTVIYGDPAVMDTMPTFAAADIPLTDALQLLLNRTAGLLTGLRPKHLEHPEHPGRYLTNQYVKAAVALGDSYLVSWRAYATSYLVRARRFRSLAAGAGLPAALVDMVTVAYVLKVQPDYAAIPDPRTAVTALAPLLLTRAREVVGECAGEPCATMADAMRGYLSLVPPEAADTRRLLEHDAIAGLLKHGAPVRAAVYSMLPLLLDALVTERAPASPHTWPAGQWLNLPREVSGWDEWEHLRSGIVAAWFAIIHP